MILRGGPPGGGVLVRRDSSNKGSDCSSYFGESPTQCLLNLFHKSNCLTLKKELLKMTYDLLMMSFHTYFFLGVKHLYMISLQLGGVHNTHG